MVFQSHRTLKFERSDASRWRHGWRSARTRRSTSFGLRPRPGDDLSHVRVRVGPEPVKGASIGARWPGVRWPSAMPSAGPLWSCAVVCGAVGPEADPAVDLTGDSTAPPSCRVLSPCIS